MNSTVKRLWHGSIRGALNLSIYLARYVPTRIQYLIADTLAEFGYRASGRYRAVGMKNLNMAYGCDMSVERKQEVVRGVFRSFARSFLAEFPRFASLSPAKVRTMVDLQPEQTEMFDSILARGKGMIVVTAHFGNFELLGPFFAADGYKIAVVVRNDNNEQLADAINKVRSCSYEVIGRGEAPKTILRRLRDGWVVAMLPDQKSDDLLIPFFGLPSGTVAGPAIMARRTGAPIVPIFCVRTPDNKHRIETGEPIYVDPAKNKDAEIRRAMICVNDAIESIVRKYPDQWLWLHDRWKNVPELIARENPESALMTT